MATLKENEELLDNSEISPSGRKDAQDVIARVKPELESVTAAEQQMQASEMEAEQQLRAEQTKLGALEDRVDRLEKELGGNPH